jgi:hypothetical protein
MDWRSRRSGLASGLSSRQIRARTLNQSISTTIDNMSYSRSFWRNATTTGPQLEEAVIKLPQHHTPRLQQMLHPGHGLTT